MNETNSLMHTRTKHKHTHTHSHTFRHHTQNIQTGLRAEEIILHMFKNQSHLWTDVEYGEVPDQSMTLILILNLWST